MKQRANKSFSFSLKHLFSATATVAIVLGVVAATGSVVLGVHISLGLAGWIIWRFAHAHPAGLIPCLLGGDILLASSYRWVFHANEAFFRGFFLMLGGSLIGIGILIFALIGAAQKRYGNHQYVCAAVIAVMLFVWWAIVPMLGSSAVAHRQAADIAANNRAAAKAIKLVEEATKSLGSSPLEDELEHVLSEPMPSVRWDRFETPINYQKTGATTFQLRYCLGDIVFYDSATPQQGWTRIPW